MQRFLESSKPCHVGIHKIALVENSRMSIPMCLSFSYFSDCLHHLYLVEFKSPSELLQELSSGSMTPLAITLKLKKDAMKYLMESR